MAQKTFFSFGQPVPARSASSPPLRWPEPDKTREVNVTTCIVYLVVTWQVHEEIFAQRETNVGRIEWDRGSAELRAHAQTQSLLKAVGSPDWGQKKQFCGKPSSTMDKTVPSRPWHRCEVPAHVVSSIFKIWMQDCLLLLFIAPREL